MILEKGNGYVPEFFLPTPSLLLNSKLYMGGVPSGVLIQFQSEKEASFKSSMALQMLGYAQKMGLNTAYIDAEGALINIQTEKGLYNPWLENLGVDPNEMYFVHGGPGEDLWEAVFELITKHNVQFVVMDSIHGVRPGHSYEVAVGDNAIGQHAKLHQQGVLKALPILKKHHAILCGINQRRDNVTPQGKMGTNPSGGASWRFYSAFTFICKAIGGKSKLEGKEYIPLEIYIDKSRGGNMFTRVETIARQGYGIDQTAELGVLAEEKGLIVKKGAWWKTADGETVGQGDDARIAWANANRELILK